MASNLVRVWKDEEYRLGLSEVELAVLPANPAGSLELTDVELALVEGGGRRKSGNSFSNRCSQRARAGSSSNVVAIQLSNVIQVANASGRNASATNNINISVSIS
jgi:mersacidin/lichenicidin family type 2 lantibiotic